MKIDEFRKILNEDFNTYQEFLKLVGDVKIDESEDWELASKAAKQLGYDVDPSEFAIAARSNLKLSEAELNSITGGGKESCVADYVCQAIYYVCNSSNECTIHTTSCTSSLCCTKNDAPGCQGGYGNCCYRIVL